MQKESVIVIGGGPCGMSCAIELQKYGINPLIIEKESIVSTIYNFPTHQTFFSSSEKLEIGEVAFITDKQKPVRNQALAYYRTVAERMQLRVNTYEKVLQVKQEDKYFVISTKKNNEEKYKYHADHVIIATGYYDQPNYMNIPGESQNKVMHYFKEAHPYYNKNIAVIGGKNSAIDTTLELHKAGANVTVFYRGSEYSKSIKPWILPEFDALVSKGIVPMKFNSQITKITTNYIYYTVDNVEYSIKNDFVFAMTGYRPDLKFLKEAGILINEHNGTPHYNQDTLETNIPGIFVAGVVAAGYNNNEIFIENGRFHGQAIARKIMKNK